MKKKQFTPSFGGFAAFVLALTLLGAGCDGGESGDDGTGIPVTFSNITADGAAFSITTTVLILTFSGEIDGLSAGDITLSGAAKGALQSSGAGAYTLALSSVEREGEITVGVSRSGYLIRPASRNIQVHYKSGPSIKEKFGISPAVTGKAGVEEAFNALHTFIQAGGLTNQPDAIKLGDWIDLEGGLEVGAYGDGGGGFNLSAANAVKPADANNAARGTWGRLIVAGINSFNGKNGNNTPHVVFHFQNIPVERRMNADDTNEGGYAKTEMRKYLVPVTGDSASGRFLAGLVSAGVPENVLWAPKRVLSAGADGTGSVPLSDLLWLPTVREMFQDGKDSNGYRPYSANGETADNQARLDYYTADSTRIKVWQERYPDTDLSNGYWLGSAFFYDSYAFCSVAFEGVAFGLEANESDPFLTGVAPAFCVW